MDADLFGSPLPRQQLDHYKQVSTRSPVICSCRDPKCPELHYLNEDGTRGPWETPIPTRREVIFRHSGWVSKRARVAAALRAADVPLARQQRFLCCGAAAYVEVNEETGESRLCGFFCGDRYCIPCGAARGVRVRRAIASLLGDRPSFLITLTQAGRDISCKEALDTLRVRLKALQRSKVWKKRFDGGCWVSEIKVGSGSGCWHAHAHGLATGRGISARALSKLWRRVTGDSFIVDVQAVRSPERAGSYVAKYLTKGFDSSLIADPDRLSECIRATSGRRMLVTWGSWYNALRDDPPERGGGWKVVGGLEGILERADAGDEWARGVIWCLRVKRGQGALDERGAPLEEPQSGEDEGGEGVALVDGS